MMASDKKHNLLVMQERKSRMTFLTWRNHKRAEPTAEQLIQQLAPLPEHMRQTITFDNGTEFAQHHKIKQKFNMQTYFCQPHKLWQKGGVENMNGRLRRFLPLKTDPKTITQEEIRMLQNIVNTTPRKCLGFKTPIEVFNKALHFKCESTFPLARE